MLYMLENAKCKTINKSIKNKIKINTYVIIWNCSYRTYLHLEKYVYRYCNLDVPFNANSFFFRFSINYRNGVLSEFLVANDYDRPKWHIMFNFTDKLI